MYAVFFSLLCVVGFRQSLDAVVGCEGCTTWKTCAIFFLKVLFWNKWRKANTKFTWKTALKWR